MSAKIAIPHGLFHLTALLVATEESETHGNTSKIKKDAKYCALGLVGTIHQVLNSKEHLTYGGFMTDIGPELAAFRIAAHELNKAIQVAAQLYEPADMPRPWTNPSMDAD